MLRGIGVSWVSAGVPQECGEGQLLLEPPHAGSGVQKIVRYLMVYLCSFSALSACCAMKRFENHQFRAQFLNHILFPHTSLVNESILEHLGSLLKLLFQKKWIAQNRRKPHKTKQTISPGACFTSGTLPFLCCLTNVFWSSDAWQPASMWKSSAGDL